VFGTSAKQGKYSVQLSLRRSFIKDGYNVAQIGTEPSGYLFGFNAVYPMGYNALLGIQNYDAVSALNEMTYVSEKSRSNPDVILVGSQSGTVPYAPYNLSNITLRQIEFILGTQPDVVVLNINVFDEPAYIKRTIQFIEGICECCVVALVVYPFEIKTEFKMRNVLISDNKLSQFRQSIEDLFGVPVFNLNSECYMQNLYQQLINSL